MDLYIKIFLGIHPVLFYFLLPTYKMEKDRYLISQIFTICWANARQWLDRFKISFYYYLIRNSAPFGPWSILVWCFWESYHHTFLSAFFLTARLQMNHCAYLSFYWIWKRFQKFRGEKINQTLKISIICFNELIMIGPI